MSKLILIMGLPKSGKTTYAKSLNGFQIHIDEIRFMTSGESKRNKSFNRITHDIARRIAMFHLKQNKDVIIEDTFLSESSRQAYLDIAKRTNSKVYLHWLDPSVTILKNRSPNNVDQLLHLSDRMEIPTLDEGFEKIIYLNDDELF